MYVWRGNLRAYAGLSCSRCGHCWNEQLEVVPSRATEVTVTVRLRVDELCPMCGVDKDNEE